MTPIAGRQLRFAKTGVIGAYRLRKTVTVNYKGKKRRKAEADESMIFKNTHEAIIDEETWELAHDSSMHFIKTSTFWDLILSVIREVSTFVRSDEKEFLHHVREQTNAGIEIEAKEQKKQLHKAEKRIAELDGLINKLYEGNATCKIPIVWLPSTIRNKAVWNRSFPHLEPQNPINKISYPPLQS